MPHTRRIETTLAACSLVGGFLANFAGIILVGRLVWPLSVALVAVGTSALIGAMLLVAAADRSRNTEPVPRPTGTE
jgi:hypothetical protein